MIGSSCDTISEDHLGRVDTSYFHNFIVQMCVDYPLFIMVAEIVMGVEEQWGVRGDSSGVSSQNLCRTSLVCVFLC
jgi:hypothetical protein